MDAPGCGAKVLCDVDELEQCSNGGTVRDLKVFSPYAHFNPLLPLLSINPLLKFEFYGHVTLTKIMCMCLPFCAIISNAVIDTYIKSIIEQAYKKRKCSKHVVEGHLFSSL